MAKKNATPEGTRKKKKQTQFSQIMGRLRKNKVAMGGLIVLIIIILAAIFAPLVAPYDPNYMDYSALNQTPSAAHIMGCDNLGRDIFSRIIYGGRYSLSLGLICAIIGMFFRCIFLEQWLAITADRWTTSSCESVMSGWQFRQHCWQSSSPHHSDPDSVTPFWH